MNLYQKILTALIKKILREKTATNLFDFHKNLSNITYALQGKQVISLVGDILNIGNLERNSTLYSGGISMTFKNNFLNPCIDNSHDTNRNRYRRLNLLCYSSPNRDLIFSRNF